MAKEDFEEDNDEMDEENSLGKTSKKDEEEEDLEMAVEDNGNGEVELLEKFNLNLKDLDENRVIPSEISTEMKRAYIDYAMSVIVARALPSVEDGLKPVHRRILWAMKLMGLEKGMTKKSARIVGDTMGKFHPHGDMSIYDSMVRMAQDFSLRYPLVHGQGNFGCFTADTKVKLADGRNLSFFELIEEHKQGKRNFTFTFDGEKIKIAEIKNPRMTNLNAEIMKVILDNGEEIKCTLNHKFMLKNGNYKEAQYLDSGESLMPCYLKYFEDRNKLIIINENNLNSNQIICKIQNNHKVVGVEFLKEFVDVYDLEIKGTHNFALASGVFVHNSSKMARDKEFQAILPLKGKILNVEKSNPTKTLSSEEIINLITAIGTGVKENFDVLKLRYNKVIIMTDADVDGSHIRTLLLTFFYRYVPELIENGNIYVAVSPLFRIRKGKDHYVYSEDELKKALDKLGGKADVQRFKGLGEMNPDQLWDTTMDPKKRILKKVTIDDAVIADSTFSMLMGDVVGPRRKFIEANANIAEVDI